jgi:hypothetical protein
VNYLSATEVEEEWEKEEPELDAQERFERQERDWKRACENADRGKTI